RHVLAVHEHDVAGGEVGVTRNVGQTAARLSGRIQGGRHRDRLPGGNGEGAADPATGGPAVAVIPDNLGDRLAIDADDRRAAAGDHVRARGGKVGMHFAVASSVSGAVVPGGSEHRD